MSLSSPQSQHLNLKDIKAMMVVSVSSSGFPYQLPKKWLRNLRKNSEEAGEALWISRGTIAIWVLVSNWQWILNAFKGYNLKLQFICFRVTDFCKSGIAFRCTCFVQKSIRTERVTLTTQNILKLSCIIMGKQDSLVPGQTKHYS